MNALRSSGVALVLGALLAATSAAAQTMQVHFIDVGQGSATLLEFSCGAILVDAGGEDNDAFHSTPVLIDYLDQFFARRTDLDRTLNALVISHPHVDHTLGIDAVLDAYTVLNAVTNGLRGGPECPVPAPVARRDCRGRGDADDR